MQKKKQNFGVSQKTFFPPPPPQYQQLVVQYLTCLRNGSIMAMTEGYLPSISAQNSATPSGSFWLPTKTSYLPFSWKQTCLVTNILRDIKIYWSNVNLFWSCTNKSDCYLANINFNQFINIFGQKCIKRWYRRTMSNSWCPAQLSAMKKSCAGVSPSCDIASCIISRPCSGRSIGGHTAPTSFTYDDAA